VLLATYFAVGALAAACLAGGDAANKCTPDKCESVGNAQICTDCQTGNVPINGVCADATASEANCKNKAGNGKADQTCEQCLNAYFMYKGGCYQTTQQPGQSMCAGASDGKCDTPADGKTYFVVPGATKTDQSVVACGDTTGVTVDTNKKYVGVDGCAKCDAPSPITGATSLTTAAATCTECTVPKIVKTVTASGKSVTSCIEPAECKDGFFVDATAKPNKCTACADDNCNVCAEAGEGKCSQCKTTGKMYLKKAEGSQTGTCVDEAGCKDGSTHYPDDAAKTCKSCTEGVPNCKTCTKEGSGNTVTCSACLEGFFVESTSTCTACADNNCAVCTAAGTGKCSKCRDGYTLDSQANTCASSSTNKSGLSTGAIAGISVAAVVVVGALIGFLCWWFLCKTKRGGVSSSTTALTRPTSS
ncbi:Variant-specific surface protein, partial [Giardia duodenalis]